MRRRALSAEGINTDRGVEDYGMHVKCLIMFSEVGFASLIFPVLTSCLHSGVSAICFRQFLGSVFVKSCSSAGNRDTAFLITRAH